jgi:hypothetical protein
VRGSSSDPVFAKDNFSAVAPPANTTWSVWLGLPTTELPDPRAVVYGAPFPVTPDLSPETTFGARGFDWSTLAARGFPLNRDGFLGLCVGSADADRIQNNHVRSPTITFKGVLGLPAQTTPFSLACTGFDANGNVLTVALLRRVMEALVPQPLFAAAFATAKKTIGTPGGFSKSFVVNPTAISMTFENRPSDRLVGQTLSSVTVKAETGLGLPMQNVGVTIEAKTNLGQPAQLSGTLTQSTDETGKVTYSDLKLFSAGGYAFHAFTTSGTMGFRPPNPTGELCGPDSPSAPTSCAGPRHSSTNLHTTPRRSRPLSLCNQGIASLTDFVADRTAVATAFSEARCTRRRCP